MPSLRRFARALLAVLTLALGSAAGSAFVTDGAGGDADNACTTVKGDIYRGRRNASWSCLAGDTKLSWNQQGPQGVPGYRGESAQVRRRAVRSISTFRRKRPLGTMPRVRLVE